MSSTTTRKEEMEEMELRGVVDADAVVNSLGLINRKWQECHSSTALDCKDITSLITDTNGYDIQTLRRRCELLATHYGLGSQPGYSGLEGQTNAEIMLQLSKMKTQVYELLSGSPMHYNFSKRGRFDTKCSFALCPGKIYVGISEDDGGVHARKIVCHSTQCLVRHWDFYDFGRLKRNFSLLSVLLHQMVTVIYPHFGGIMRHSLRVSKSEKLECMFVFLQYYSIEHLSPVYGREYSESAFKWFGGLYNTVTKILREASTEEYMYYTTYGRDTFTDTFSLWLLIECTPKRTRRPSQRVKTGFLGELPDFCVSAHSESQNRLIAEHLSTAKPDQALSEPQKHNEDGPTDLCASSPTQSKISPVVAEAGSPVRASPGLTVQSPTRILELVHNPTDKLDRFLSVEMEEAFGDDADMEYARNIHQDIYGIPDKRKDWPVPPTPLEGDRPLCKRHGLSLEFMTARLGSRKWLGDETIVGFMDAITQFHKGKLGPTHKYPVVISSTMYTGRFYNGSWHVRPKVRRQIEANDYNRLSDQVDMVVLVVNEYGHWKMLIAKPNEGQGGIVQCWDSGGQGPAVGCGEHIEAIIKWFEGNCKESERSYWVGRRNNWTIEYDPKNKAVQHDGVSCGIFVLLHFLYILNGWEEKAVEFSGHRLDMDGQVRIWIIYSLLKSRFVDPFGRKLT